MIFYGVAGMVFVTAIIFNLTAEASPRSWTASPDFNEVPNPVELKIETFSNKIFPIDSEKKESVKFGI